MLNAKYTEQTSSSSSVSSAATSRNGSVGEIHTFASHATSGSAQVIMCQERSQASCHNAQAYQNVLLK